MFAIVLHHVTQHSLMGKKSLDSIVTVRKKNTYIPKCKLRQLPVSQQVHGAPQSVQNSDYTAEGCEGVNTRNFGIDLISSKYRASTIDFDSDINTHVH